MILRFGILILLFATVIQTGHSQAMEVEQLEIDITQSKNKYIIKLYDSVVLDGIDSIGSIRKTKDYYLVKKNAKYGVYSKFGDAVIPVNFDEISRLYNEYWMVRVNGKTGVYSLYKRKILPAEYDHVIFSGRVGAEFIVKTSNGYGVFDSSGAIIVPIEYELIGVNGGVIELTSGTRKSRLMGSRIITDNVISSKSFAVRGDDLRGTQIYYVFERSGKHGIMNHKGEVHWEPTYDEIIPHLGLAGYVVPENLMFVRLGQKWGIKDVKGNVFAPIEYQSVAMGNDDYALVGVNGSKQFFDLKNKRLVDGITFDRYYYISKYSRIEKGGLVTLIDNETMKLVLPLKYDDISWDDETGLFSVGIKGTYGVVDINDKVIIPFMYSKSLFIHCGGKMVVEKDNKYGIIDLKNNLILPYASGFLHATQTGFERLIGLGWETEQLDCDLKVIKQK